jgi:hypothetical protein
LYLSSHCPNKVQTTATFSSKHPDYVLARKTNQVIIKKKTKKGRGK